MKKIYVLENTFLRITQIIFQKGFYELLELKILFERIKQTNKSIYLKTIQLNNKTNKTKLELIKLINE